MKYSLRHTLRLAFLTSPFDSNCWREAWKARLLVTTATFAVYIGVSVMILAVFFLLRFVTT